MGAGSPANTMVRFPSHSRVNPLPQGSLFGFGKGRAVSDCYL
ncbi:hypothetical protein RK21_03459 [Pseudomonas plecoglossicida]|nr:hypothetical protein RK21_03459 [Pseudomonas plecoglossicida]